MKRLVIIGIVALCALLIGSALGAPAKTTTTEDGTRMSAAMSRPDFKYIPAPPEIQRMMSPLQTPINYIPKRPGHYSAQDWRSD